MNKSYSNVIDAMSELIDVVAENHPNRRIADRLLRQGMDGELQYIPDISTGVPVVGKKGLWRVGDDIVHSIRIPKNASREPYFDDYVIGFDLLKHMKSLGGSGWNWQELKSDWVVFDVDSLADHAGGISQQQFDEVTNTLATLDYVELTRSAGGIGIHAYVDLEGFRTTTHDEHAAVARAVLAQMSRDTGLNLKQYVDCFGRIGWVWRKG